ncbi:Serine/threonine-protein kinase, partial [Coemansia biformis]
GIGLRTLSHEICPIDTTQDDDNNCGAIDKDADVVPPANPAGASAGGAPRTAEPAVPKPQPEMPTVPEKPASPIAQVPPAELPAPADDAKADVAPGLQAATAMMVKAPSTDDTIPGYTPIAVSLKGSRSRQFLLNTPLGEFSVERTLGQGSYGKVKLMRSALTHEQFAVKIIKRFPPHKHRRSHHEYRKAKTLDRRVVREANLAAILGQLHPHIVPLHDFRVTDTHFYLFYAFVNGVTLAERVGGGGLSENEARAVFKPVAETINFCHQYSVIHRDIKLENVLIDYADEARSPWELVSSENSFQPSTLHAHRSQRSSNNMDSAREWVQRRRRSTSGHAALARQRSVPSDTSTEPPDFRAASVFDGRVKLIDFGLANFFDGTSLMDTFCGSLPYTAPEILRGDAYVGPEIDVWSLGVLLYVMHTGSFPFDDPAQPKNFEKIANGDFPTMGGIHERRTLVLPGPRAHRLIAREVAVCLGRGTDEVTRAIDKALANGTPLPPAEQQPQSRPPRVQSRSRAQSDPPPRSQQHQQQRQQQHREHRQVDTEVWSPLAPLHQWPRELQDLGASGILVEVANSPFVSVYALVLQQIGMRRYYLELPVPEHPHATGADAVSSTSLFAMPGSVPLAPRGLRALDSSPDPSARSRALATRLATQFASLASLTGNLVGGNGGGKHGAQPADPPTEPAYVKPLSMGASMPLLPQSARHGQSPANDASEPYIRTIPSAAAATADDSGTRIPLPNELAGLPASQVLSLVSRLLTMHEIAHTFVETQRMPMHKALNSSMFSLKTVAALMESHQNLSQPADTPDTADTLTSQDMLDVLSGDLATDTEHPERERSQTGSHIRSLLHSMFPRGPAAADSHSGSAPDIMTTIPVDHPAATILAQYSPSLNRWRETEVVEYYSCSVRIELVRLSPHRRFIAAA